MQEAIGEKLGMMIFCISTFFFSLFFILKTDLVTVDQVVIFPLILLLIYLAFHLLQVMITSFQITTSSLQVISVSQEYSSLQESGSKVEEVLKNIRTVIACCSQEKELER